MQNITVKFGGTSLASAEQFKKVAEIIRSNPARRYVVASAPGKREKSDIKVTDMLLRCYDYAAGGADFEPLLSQIEERFAQIISGVGISFDLTTEINTIRKHLMTAPKQDYMASRGEYINSKILAAYLQFPFVDPATCVCFQGNGVFDAERTNRLLGAALKKKKYAVIAGFYGANPDGSIRTFSRGGSDVTGSLVARATQADLYENWTDVSGMLATDPRIVENPSPIEFISYQELRELSYMGASVLHEDAVFPVRKAGIPINIRNTNRPEDAGSMIVSEIPAGAKCKTVTGIAGRAGFSIIQIEKSMMNSEVGFCARVLQLFAERGISIEHIPTGIDTMSVVVNKNQFLPDRDDILNEIQDKFNPDVISVVDDIAIIAVVGHGMALKKGIAASVFDGIADADINIRMIDQGSSELNIIVGVDATDLENTIRAIYKSVFKNEE